MTVLYKYKLKKCGDDVQNYLDFISFRKHARANDTNIIKIDNSGKSCEVILDNLIFASVGEYQGSEYKGGDIKWLS